MMYKNPSEKMVLVGDVYHWELDQNGYFIIKDNISKGKTHNMDETEFETINPNNIMEDLKDE